MANEKIIDVFDVAVPCQQFVINASVSAHTKLGLAEEYALSLIHLLGAATRGDFQRFFGFPEEETLNLITWLMRNEFVEWRDGMLRLASRGHIAFAESSDGVPTLVKHEEITEKISLERLSFTPVSQFAGRVPAIVPELPAVDLDFNLQQVVALSVERHYDEWSKEWKRKVESADMLYGVHAVAPQGVFATRESVPLVLDVTNGQVHHRLDLSDLQRRGRLRSRDALLSSIRQYIQQTQFPADVKDALAFISSFDEGILSSYKRLDRFDIKRWICDPRNDSKGVWTFTGSSVSDDCADLLTRLTASLPADTDDSSRLSSPILWLMPHHRFWGASARHSEAIARLGATAAHRGGVILVTRKRDQVAGLRQSAQKNALVWAKAPASIIVSDGAKLPRSLEVIIDPGRWIVAIVYQRHGADNLPIGAGFCSAKRNVVNKGMRAIARAIDKDYAVSKLSSNNEVINEKPDVELLALMKSWERQ